MRDIKFRAWDKKHGVMFEPLTLVQIADSQPSKRVEDIENLIFLQYTGLKDKNGKEIYEGDIIGFGDNDRGMVVSYSNGMNEFLGMNVGWFLEQDDFARWDELKYEGYYEVIGNIHENKELLK